MEEIQDLSKNFGFDNLTYHYKGKNVPKILQVLQVHKVFIEKEEKEITIKKAEEQQKELKSNVNEIIVGRKKSEDEKNAIKNIKSLYQSREKVIELFDDYSRIASEAKYKTKY